jgi:V/A-type H+-transporting ATPase subunit E
MDNKLQEITEKIYLEGVSKGNEEAQKIISGAKTDADKIISKAEEDASEIIARAEKKAEEIKKNTASELKLSFRQAMSLLRQDMEKTITLKMVDEPVSDVFSDKRFIAGLIEKIAEKWSPAVGSGDDMEIHLSEESAGDIEKYLGGKVRKILGEKISLHPVKSMEKGFEIHPSEGGYKISVTESGLASYLKELLRPKLIELLFEKE